MEREREREECNGDRTAEGERGGRGGGEEPVFHHREPCKFPPPTRRRFSLIADRSSCWVINVQHRRREEKGRDGSNV